MLIVHVSPYRTMMNEMMQPYSWIRFTLTRQDKYLHTYISNNWENVAEINVLKNHNKVISQKKDGSNL